MKDTHANISLGKLCRLLGVTRQAYYQHFNRLEAISFEQQLVVKEVHRIRKRHRRMGTRKLHELLEPFLLEHQIKMGRDALFKLLAAHNLLVQTRRRTPYTTNSFHWFKKYPNLVTNLTLSSKNQLWVSDMTYWKINGKFVYLSFVTDAFSHKIVGYHVADNMRSSEPLKALKMAILGLKKEPDSHLKLLHHSDRGIQYCSSEYVELLRLYNIGISMTENSDPRENAIAERVNGIIKNEYLRYYQVENLQQAKKALKQAISYYNQERPHMSIDMLTPEVVHEFNLSKPRFWKSYPYSNKDTANKKIYQ